MSKSALLDLIPEDRRKIIYHEEDGKTYMETRQDVSHIVKAAAMMRDETPGKDMRRVALVPKTVLDQSFNEGWFHDEAKWKQWLNDPGNACYRTWHGRV